MAVLDDRGVRVEDRTLTPSVVLNAEPMSLKIDGLSTAKGVFDGHEVLLKN